MSSTSSARSHRVMGLLESQLDRGFHRAALRSIAAAARATGANLVCFDGGVLAADGGSTSMPNVLYDLVGPANVDGLIIWASALDWELTAEQTEAFCRRFAPLPVVTVGRVFDGIPGVLVDNYQGMREAARHLIVDHGFSRIAFLRGPEGAEEEELRFRAYCDALRDAGIPFDPRLVSSRTQWQRPDGPVVITELLDERGLRPGADFQAILAVGDDMACGAIEALRGRGVRVPDDVAVVGFNDDEEGRSNLPALTTVAQPVAAMGSAAVAMLSALLDEQPTPSSVTLPLGLAVRRSCGCMPPGVLQAAALTNGGEAGDVAARTARLAGLALEPVRELVDAFLAELAAPSPPGFLQRFGARLQSAALNPHDGGEIAQWRTALSAMRGAMLPALSEPKRSRAENLWQQAQALIGETAAQARAYEHFRADQDTRRLSEFSQRIQTAANRAALYDALAAGLPHFGVTSCFLTLYEDAEQPAAGARLVLALDRGARFDLPRDGLRFPTHTLLPEALAEWPESLLTLPLYFAARQLGCLLISADERGLALSETFRAEVSAALDSLFLREEIREAWQKAEESNLLKSRFLSTVSHELRTPLSLIVGTIEMMQRDASIETVFAGPAGEGFRRDLDSIRTGAQHLSHLIGDVLDLASSQAGELRLSCAPLPLGDVLSRVAVLGETMARERGLAWRVDLGGGIEGPLPLVWGDRTRLQQVALNLISNAVKFTAKGTITLWVEVGAREVMVAVSDTGMGIPLAEQGLIFDEFRQSDRAARRGFGGMGLGLAISKRLVELHGGRMGVLSTGAEGSGSTFYFTLPVLTEAAVAAERLPQGGDAVLLLTEREPARGTPTAALRDHLLARGFVVSVLPVSERSDWLAQIVAAPPGAIALDYEPAAEQAWDLMRVLKLDPATSDIPVLFFALGDDERGAVLAMDYLAKPLGGEALAGALARQGLSDSERAFDILVVDDDETMRELHARMVRSALPAARVLTAADGRAALQVMEEICPHLVLLDLMMPELDGFGVLEAMRDDPQLRGVPVIVLTAQILGRREMERLQGGVSAVLAKGLFEQGEVLAQVEAVLARGKRLGSEAQRVARMAMAYIHERYAEPVSREQMARDLNVNERYLTRCFGQETGLTPIAYLNRYRIAQARALLDRSRLSVTEVALACGFSDSSYFGRVFQKEVGLSPTVYRRHTLSHPD